MANRKGKSGSCDRLYFLGLKITVNSDCRHEIKRHLLLGRRKPRFVYGKPRQCIKKQRHHFADKGLYSQSYGFSSSHVWMWELDHKEGWMPKNWCFELWCWRILESPLDCKEIQPVNPKGNQPWIVTERADAEAEAEAEALIVWPPAEKSWLIGKAPDAGKDWRQMEKGVAEDKMVGWHHQLGEHEFEQTPGDSRGQRSLACCSPWGYKELDMT